MTENYLEIGTPEYDAAFKASMKEGEEILRDAAIALAKLIELGALDGLPQDVQQDAGVIVKRHLLTASKAGEDT